MRAVLFIMASVFAATSSLSSAQTAGPLADGGPSADLVIDGPPPPAAPEMIARDGNGRATVRAIKLTEPLRVDGKLDEAVYSEFRPFGDLLQVAPKYLVPASEETDIWVMFDAHNIYVGARLWDSHPADEWVSNELRRDTNQLRENDHFGVMFDTYYDRRSGFVFYTNTMGALADYSVFDEGSPNKDWNPVWDSRTARFDGGWTVEMVIPFKTLRYRSGHNQVWGFQARRAIRHQNEWAYLTSVPRQIAGPQAFNRISAAGTLIGLDLPPATKNIELEPYAIGRVESDTIRTPRVLNDPTINVGGDVKLGISANLTADVTFNTDFAQVEVDEQQVNLTRFNLQFPEKRDFFLEGRGVFDFGRGGTGGDGSGGDTPYLFYSRRIGLNGNRVVPIDAGGRVTGKVGAFALGLMNIQAGDAEAAGTLAFSPAANFTVVRVKRDILRRSNIGAMFTNRSNLASGSGSNQAYGVDASFAFFQNLSTSGYYAKTDTAARQGDDDSYQVKFDFVPDRYGVRAEHLKVGSNFNPEVGFVRRDDFRKSSLALRFSPRPRNSRLVRKVSWEGSVDYFENGAGLLESRQVTGRFSAEFNSSDRFAFETNRNFEQLFAPFTVQRGVNIPPGGYSFDDYSVSYNFGQQRPVSGNVSLLRGEFYDGTITTFGLNGARIAILKQFSLEPRVSINRVELPRGSFTTRLVGSRADYGFSPRMFASALLQYSSSERTFSSNLRFRWEYRPGSEFFLVWTDERDTFQARPDTRLRNRAFVVKMTRLFRF